MKTYPEWIIETWYNAEGLIQPSIAAKILNITSTRVLQLWKLKRYKIYKYDERERPLISWKDVMAYKTERDAKKRERQ